MPPSGRLVALAAALLLVAGCGPVPRPFAHVGPAHDNPLLYLPGGLGIQVVAPAGIEPAFADAIATDLARRLAAGNIPAQAGGAAPASLVLLGAASAVDGAASQDERGPVIGRIDWRLMDSRGRQVIAFEQRVRGDAEGWAAGDPELAAVIAADAGESVGAMLAGRPLAAGGRDGPASLNAAGGPPVIAAAVDALPRVAVLPVAGAPGDGSRALAESLRRALLRDGRALTGEPAEAAYVVSGAVTLGDLRDGRLQLDLEWQITGRDGRYLGRIRQSNPVRAAAVEGSWGRLADLVATAASPGILDVLARVEAATANGRGPPADGGGVP